MAKVSQMGPISWAMLFLAILIVGALLVGAR